MDATNIGLCVWNTPSKDIITNNNSILNLISTKNLNGKIRNSRKSRNKFTIKSNNYFHIKIKTTVLGI
jgi:hypothetical protein